MAQPSCCIRGHQITIRNRNFKRRSTMLKHGRWMQNLQVTPVLPVLQEVVPNAGDDEEAGSANSDD